MAETRRIASSSVGPDPQRTGVRLGSVPPCVLRLLGSRPRPESRCGGNSSFKVREEYSAPVGVWSTEIGPLNTVVHLWAYRDPNHRAETRRAAAADPVWKDTASKLGPLMQTMASTLLVPTSFSPLR